MSQDIRWKQRFDNFDRAYLSVFEQAVDAIAARYLPAVQALHQFFAEKIGEVSDQ